MLHVLGPDATLRRGYSITINERGQIIRTIAVVRPKMKCALVSATANSAQRCCSNHPRNFLRFDHYYCAEMYGVIKLARLPIRYPNASVRCGHSRQVTLV